MIPRVAAGKREDGMSSRSGIMTSAGARACVLMRKWLARRSLTEPLSPLLDFQMVHVALVPRVKPRFLSQLFPKLAFALAHSAGHLDSGHHDQIPIAVPPHWKSAPANPKLLAILGSRRDFDIYSAIESRKRQAGPQDSFPGGDGGFTN